MEKMRNVKKRKGFTLIELIVVIAILGILAAIAVPRMTGMRANAQLSADGATAATLANFARIQEVDTGVVVTDENFDTTKYGAFPTPKSGGTFKIGGGGTSMYTVTWTSTLAPYDRDQTLTEGTKFVPLKK